MCAFSSFQPSFHFNSELVHKKSKGLSIPWAPCFYVTNMLNKNLLLLPVGMGSSANSYACFLADFKQMVGVETWMFFLIVVVILLDGFIHPDLPSVFKAVNSIVAIIATLVIRIFTC